ncbi:MAG: M20/M25/M40 family metallo-hydrolase, partial [Bacteroidia bacterium]
QPFSGEIVDGRLHGRGSVDMKSSVAASVYAGAIAKKSGLTAGRTIYVTCTVSEEDCDGENLKHLLKELGLKPGFVVICEPSGNRIALGHKGKAQVKIITHGIPAHGSAPEKGLNAIYEMAEIIHRTENLNARLAGNGSPHGTIVLSQISSTSESLNAVPSECEIYLDRRMIEGENEETIRSEMDKLVEGKRATWEVGTLYRKSWTGLDIVYKPMHTAWKIEPDHDLTRKCILAYNEYYGTDHGSFEYWDFSTNAVTPVRMGIPTIGFGPGDYKLAHMRNESCEVNQIIDACGFYIKLIAKV